MERVSERGHAWKRVGGEGGAKSARIAGQMDGKPQSRKELHPPLTDEALQKCILGSAEEIAVYRDGSGRWKRVHRLRIGSVGLTAVAELSGERGS